MKRHQWRPHIALLATLILGLLPAGTMLGTVRAAAAGPSFDPATSYPTGASPFALATADFDADGILDLAVSNTGADSVGVRRGTGTGTFEAAVDYPIPDISGAPTPQPTRPEALVAADFNEDGRPDLVVGQAANTVRIALNLGGTFGEWQRAGSGVYGGPRFMAPGDFDGDGHADLATGSYGGGALSLLLGNGDGTFRTARDFLPNQYDGIRALAAGDFDQDGRDDVALADVGYGVLLFYGTASGTLAPGPTSNTPDPTALAVGDIDLDGRPDLAVGTGDGTVAILRNTGTALVLAGSYPAGGSPAGLALGDIHADGRLDLAATNRTAGMVSLLPGTGPTSARSFGAPAPTAAGAGPTALIIGDFNRDGAPDVAALNRTSATISVLLAASATLPLERDLSVKCTQGAGDQRCAPPVTLPVTSVDSSPLTFGYRASPNHCSPVRLHVSVDGALVLTTAWLGWPGATGEDAALPLAVSNLRLGNFAAGRHALSLQAEARTSTSPGSCNVGRLDSWGGQVTLAQGTTSSPAPSPTPPPSASPGTDVPGIPAAPATPGPSPAPGFNKRGDAKVYWQVFGSICRFGDDERETLGMQSRIRVWEIGKSSVDEFQVRFLLLPTSPYRAGNDRPSRDDTYVYPQRPATLPDNRGNTPVDFTSPYYTGSSDLADFAGNPAPYTLVARVTWVRDNALDYVRNIVLAQCAGSQSALDPQVVIGGLVPGKWVPGIDIFTDP